MARQSEPNLPPVPAEREEDRADRIGRQLRQIFDESLAEPIPDVFADLLRKLD